MDAGTELKSSGTAHENDNCRLCMLTDLMHKSDRARHCGQAGGEEGVEEVAHCLLLIFTSKY